MVNRVVQFTTAQSNALITYEIKSKYYMDNISTYGPIMACVKVGQILQECITIANNSVIVNHTELKEILMDLCNYAALGWLQIKNTMSKIHTYDILQKNAKELFINKNADYGDAFANFGVVGVLVRIGDKVARLETSVSDKKFKVKDESILDTLIDLYNYSIMAMMLMQ